MIFGNDRAEPVSKKVSRSIVTRLFPWRPARERVSWLPSECDLGRLHQRIGWIYETGSCVKG